MLINIQERVFNTKTPFTHLWYSQGGYDYVASDGILSQNIAKNWNATIGYRRQSSTSRFLNSDLDLWNIRANIRWSPTSKTTFTLSELFTHRRTGVNGGIDSTSPSISNELIAVPKYAEFNERVYRHEVTLSGTTLLTDDTTSSLSGSLLFKCCMAKEPSTLNGGNPGGYFFISRSYVCKVRNSPTVRTKAFRTFHIENWGSSRVLIYRSICL
ncbi:MAG: hypothetical protein IPM69_01785 [Ignavibacteria bacterium]|nr:hypothetical protein [Ignavibacteria bacterium]